MNTLTPELQNPELNRPAGEFTASPESKVFNKAEQEVLDKSEIDLIDLRTGIAALPERLTATETKIEAPTGTQAEVLTSAETHSLQAELAAQIERDIQEFTQSLDSSGNIWTRATRFLPKLREFWRRRSVRWTRLGLSWGLYLPIIGSIIVGAWPSALVWLGARAVVGTVSSFMGAQDLQERAERQRETHSMTTAFSAEWEVTKHKPLWKRPWGVIRAGWASLSAFGRDDVIDASNEAIASMSARDAREVAVEAVSPVASSIQDGRTDAERNALLAGQAARNQLTRLTPERYGQYALAIRNRHTRYIAALRAEDPAVDLAALGFTETLSDEVVRQRIIDGLSQNVLGIQRRLGERQGQAERRVKFSLSLAAASAFGGGFRFATAALDHFHPAQLESFVATTNTSVDAPTSDVHDHAEPGWLPEDDGTAVHVQPDPRLVANLPVVTDGVEVQGGVDIDHLVEQAHFTPGTGGIQEQNFRKFMQAIGPKLKTHLLDMSTRPMGERKEALAHLEVMLKTQFREQWGETNFRVDGGTVTFQGYHFGPRLSAYVLTHTHELSEHPDQLYKLLSLTNAEELLTKGHGQIDINHAYALHEQHDLLGHAAHAPGHGAEAAIDPTTQGHTGGGVASHPVSGHGQELTQANVTHQPSTITHHPALTNGGGSTGTNTFHVGHAPTTQPAEVTTQVTTQTVAEQGSQAAAGSTPEFNTSGVLQSDSREVEEASSFATITSASDMTHEQAREFTQRFAESTQARLHLGDGALRDLHDHNRAFRALDVMDVTKHNGFTTFKTELGGQETHVQVNHTGHITGVEAESQQPATVPAVEQSTPVPPTTVNEQSSIPSTNEVPSVQQTPASGEVSVPSGSNELGPVPAIETSPAPVPSSESTPTVSPNETGPVPAVQY